MRHGFLRTAGLLALVAGSSANAQTFYTESFDSAVLNQKPQDTWAAGTCVTPTPVFTHTPPAGWDWNNCGTRTYACRNPLECGTQQTCGTCANSGFREYDGWTYASKAWWIGQQGDQRRSEFTKGIGNVAIADPDGWDDRGSPASGNNFCGYMNAFMTTPAINIAGADADSLAFSFDSSWRPEGFDDGPGTNNQTATIRAFYTVDGAELPAVEVLHWDSNPNGPFFYADLIHTNETIVLNSSNLQVPAGATSVRFEFGMTNAGNDWWWAVDNLAATVNVAGNIATRYSEDFEGVTLEPALDSAPTGCRPTYCGQNVFTHDGPNGLTVAVDSPASGGVPEWRGWSFTTRPYWYCAANNNSGSNNGALFTNSSGIIAVADGDEFDDASHAPGALDTSLRTPEINIAGRNGNVMVLSFDSSWRWESGQTATIEATFDGDPATTTEVLRWESDTTSQFFKNDAPNERAAVTVVAPDGAQTVQLRFRYVGGNNWWWAVDNLSLFQGVASVSLLTNAPSTVPMTVAPSIDYAACFTPWSPEAPAGWTNVFNPIGACPDQCGRTAFRGWTFLDKNWWIFEQGNQERSNFTKGRGFVAVADNDAWDDSPNGRSNFNAFLTTPAQPLPSNLSSASLNFDSSWRPEGLDDRCSCDLVVNIASIAPGAAGQIVFTTDNPHALSVGDPIVIGSTGDASVPGVDGRYSVTAVTSTTFTVNGDFAANVGTGSGTRTPTNNQTAIIRAIYTVGGSELPGVEVLHWDSDPSSIFYYPDGIHENDSIALDRAALQIPAGASAVRFEFSLTNSRNDWWWAIDNVTFNVNDTQIFAENFENVPGLQATPLDDVPPPASACSYFSSVSAQGGNLSVDNSLVGSCPTSGGDFDGWSAWVTAAWARAGGGARQDFLPATTYVSDFGQRGCVGTSRFVTPNYGIAAINPGSLILNFDSSWGTGLNHSSRVQVSYDNGNTWSDALVWNPDNKSTTGNETVTLFVDNPLGAQSIRFRFEDSNSGWWALSNLSLAGTVGSAICDPDVNQDGNADQGDVDYVINVIAGGDNPTNIDPDFNQDGNSDQGDIDALVNVIAGGNCP